MDTRYLRKRGGVWHVDLRIPLFSPTGTEEKRFRASLETADHKAAAKFRDKYIVPLLHGRSLDKLKRGGLRLFLNRDDDNTVGLSIEQRKEWRHTA